ncbi:hypothetical protein Trydic_g4013 [Trypoxylus dichotomus]
MVLKAWLQRLGLKLQSHIDECTVANGEECCSLDYVSVPIQLEDKINVINILVLPDLHHHLILGVDFWIAFHIVLDLHKSFWHFSDAEPCIFVSSKLAIFSLNESQKHTLDEFILSMKELMRTSLGGTHLIIP